jgi:2-polyprenyl-3-methyl-5-hydroxy-6-metoxy-1,4-benzoquinol methylase
MNDAPQQGGYGYLAREDVAPFIPREARSALDVGCSEGGFSVSLRAALGPDARLVGIEAVPESATVARERSLFDEVVTGYFPAALEGRTERFDLISFTDVLEHIYDPRDVLVQAKDFLTPDGAVLACLPNIQYAPIVWQLIRGRWDYTEQGILDRTHVRFFTRATMVELFLSAGYRVDLVQGVNNIIKDKPAVGRGHRRKLRHLLGPAQWIQFVIVARPLP